MATYNGKFMNEGVQAPSLVSLIQGRRDRLKQSKLAELLSGAYAAEGANRQQMIGQAIALDPSAGMSAARMLDPRLQSAAASGVQSTFINDKGERVAIMRDGSVQTLGKNAPQNQIIDTGDGFFGVNKSSLSAAPVQIGQPQQPSQTRAQGDPQAPQPMQQVQYATSDGAPIPPGEQAAAQAAFAADAQGGDFAIRVPAGGGPMQSSQIPQQGQQLRSVPKPQDAIRMQMDAERLRLAQAAEQRAQEASGRGAIPPGMRMVNGRLEPIPGAPSQTPKLNAVVVAKIPQLQNAIRGISRIDTALKGLEGKLMDTGPMDALIQRFTPAGQELEAAVGAIQNSVLALTRVPGVGSQSDLEARQAALQYPSLDKPPEVNRRTVENLKLFMRDLAEAYKLAVQPSQQAQKPAASGGVDDLLSKYGVK